MILDQETPQAPNRVLISPDQFVIGVPIPGSRQVDELGIALRFHLLLTQVVER